MLPSLSESTPFFSTSFHLQKNRQWKGACLDSAAEIGVKINLGEMQRQSGKVSALIAYESLCCERSGQRGGWNCWHCWEHDETSGHAGMIKWFLQSPFSCLLFSLAHDVVIQTVPAILPWLDWLSDGVHGSLCLFPPPRRARKTKNALLKRLGDSFKMCCWKDEMNSKNLRNKGVTERPWRWKGSSRVLSVHLFNKATEGERESGPGSSECICFNYQVKYRARVRCVLASSCYHWSGRRGRGIWTTPPVIFYRWILRQNVWPAAINQELLGSPKDTETARGGGEGSVRVCDCITASCSARKDAMLDLVCTYCMCRSRPSSFHSEQDAVTATDSTLTPCAPRSNLSGPSTFSAFFAHAGIPRENCPFWHRWRGEKPKSGHPKLEILNRSRPSECNNIMAC